METRERRKSRMPDRPWDSIERAKLKRLANEGYDTIRMASILKHSRVDVMAEVERMGLNEGYTPDPLEVPKTMRPCLSCGKEFLSRVGHVCGRCKERGEFQSSASDFCHDLNSRKGRM